MSRPLDIRSGASVLNCICSVYDLEPLEVLSALVSEEMTGGGWVLAPGMNLEFYSDLFLRRLGREPGLVDHRPDSWMRWILPEDLQPSLDIFQRHAESRGEIPYDKCAHYLRPDGGIVTVQCRGEVLRWSVDGRVNVMVGRHIDLTPIER